MTLNCYIIDDEYSSIEIVSRYIAQTPLLHLLGSATNPLEALNQFATGLKPDITFIDIDMPQLNGLDLAELIGPSTTVIFTTAYREYAPEAFDKNAVDYLLKPIIYPRFLKAITKASSLHIQAVQADQVDHFFVKSNVKGKFHRIDIAEIRYIENIGNYITIHFDRHQSPVTTYLTLNEVLTKLPETQFSRIHQSYVVNHAYILSIEYAQLRLPDQVVLPIGGTYRTTFRDKIQTAILISKREQKSR